MNNIKNYQQMYDEVEKLLIKKKHATARELCDEFYNNYIISKKINISPRKISSYLRDKYPKTRDNRRILVFHSK